MLRDRRSLAIMFGVPLVLYPLLTVVIGTIGISKQKELSEKPARVAIVNASAAPHLAEMLKAPDSGVTVTDPQQPDQELVEGTIDAVIVIPQGAQADALDSKPAEILLRLDRSRTQSMFVETRLTKILNNYDRWIIEQRLRDRGQPESLLLPLDRRIEDVATADQRFGKLMAMSLPVLLLATGMLGALFPALNATTTERELGTLETLLVSPAGRMELLTAKGTLVLLSGLLTAGLNMLSMALVLWRSFSLIEAQMGSMEISLPKLALTYLAAVPTLITFSTLALIIGLLARNFREANHLATPVMLIPLASMLIAIAEPPMSRGLLVTPVANTTVIIREVLTGRVTPGPFILASISSCVYAGLFLSLASRLFTNEQLVNPSWEPLSLKGLRPGRRRERPRRLPSVDEALALFSVALLLSFYVAPSLQRFGLVPMLLVQQVLLLAGPAILLAWIGKYRWIETFAWRKPALIALGGAVLLGIGLAPWMQFAGMLQQKLWPRAMEGQWEQLKFLLPPLAAYPILIPLLIGVLAGVCEETLFRGPIQTGLMRRLPKWPAIVVAALLFAAAHMDIHGIPIRTFLGILLGWVVVHTGSVFPAMVMHGIYDITQLLHVGYEVRKVGVDELLASASTAQNEPINGWVLLIAAVMVLAGWQLLRRSATAQRDAAALI